MNLELVSETSETGVDGRARCVHGEPEPTGMLVWLAGFNDLYSVFFVEEDVLWVSFHSTRVQDGMRLQGVPPKR